MMRILVVVLSVMMATGCATSSGLEHFHEKSRFATPPEIMVAEKNPAYIVQTIKVSAANANQLSNAGARAGGDLGAMVSGNTIGEMVVGGVVGMVAMGVTGFVGDRVTQAAADDDLYFVRALSAYMKGTREERFGGQGYYVRFMRKDVAYKPGDMVVIVPTKEKIKMQTVYKAVDIFDADVGDTNSVSYLRLQQEKARQLRINQRVAPQTSGT